MSPVAEEQSAALCVSLLTALEPGAVAVLQLSSSSPQRLAVTMEELTGLQVTARERFVWRPLAGVDDGLVLLGEDHALIMPHGGPRVVQRVMERLVQAGARVQNDPPAEVVYPEATSLLEGLAMAALAAAASPAALDVLAAQAVRWQNWWEAGQDMDAVIWEGALNHLLSPPTVVVAGRPNVGKSTLTNYLLGRAAALVANLPGTTRDWVAGMAELPLPWQGEDAFLAVRWLDTPGLRESEDPIEQRAIVLAREVMTSAQLLIAMRSPDLDWPESGELPREPDLWVENKADLKAGFSEAAYPPPSEGCGRSAEQPLRISAREGVGIDPLQAAIVQKLGLDAEPGEQPWAFCPSLRALRTGKRGAIERLLQHPQASGN